jgi:hypothetical protein
MNFFKKNLHYIILAIIFLISFSYIFNSKLDLNGDNFNYLIFSKAIAQGKGYISPISGNEVPVNFYPPGYPAILAFFHLFIGNNIHAYKIINGIFLLISVMLLFLISKNITQKTKFFLFVSALILLNFHVLRFSTMIMSEMSFLLFYSLSFFFVYKLPTNDKFYKSPYLYLLILSLSISYYIRTIGIAIFLATIIHYFIHKHWKISFSIIGGFILLYVPWSIRNHIYGIKSRYLGTIMTVNPWRPEEGNITSLSEFIDKMIANFDETVIKGFVDSLFPFLNIQYQQDSTFLFIIFSIIILSIIFIGAYNMGRLKYLFIFFLLGNIGIFMLWHGGNGIRYVIPVIPVIFITFYNGILWLINKLVKSKNSLLWGYALIIIIGILTVPTLKKLNLINSQNYPPGYKNYIAIAKSLKENTPKNTIVCGRKPEILYYFSERPSFNYKYSKDTDEVIRNLTEKNVDYVILDQLGYSSTSRYLYPAIKNNPDLFKTVIHLKNPDTYLLQFIKPPEQQ